MGTKGRCAYCKRPVGWRVYCPLRDMDTLTCVFGAIIERADRAERNDDAGTEKREA